MLGSIFPTYTLVSNEAKNLNGIKFVYIFKRRIAHKILYELAMELKTFPLSRKFNPIPQNTLKGSKTPKIQ